MLTKMISSAVQLVMCSSLIITIVTAVNPFQSENNMVTSFSNAKPRFNKDEPHVCSVYIYTDPFLWRQMYKLQGNKLFHLITITAPWILSPAVCAHSSENEHFKDHLVSMSSQYIVLSHKTRPKNQSFWVCGHKCK